MYLTKAIHIKRNNPAYEELDKMMFLSKNLYNTCLYRERKCYFEKRDKVKAGIEDDSPWFIKEYDLAKELAHEKQVDFKALPSAVAQQVCYQVAKEFKAFFKQKKTNSHAGIPRYKDKEKGRNVLKYSLNGLSAPKLKQGILKLAKSELKFPIPDCVPNDDIQEVHFNFTHNQELRMYIIYQVADVKLKKANSKYAAIDLGVNNLAALATNSPKIKPIIINGRPLKSINQEYNRHVADLKAKLSHEKGNRHVSKQINSLNNKREHRISDYLHKSSCLLVNHLVSNKVNTLVIGYNKDWKQEINIGHANNQTFVGIPHKRLIDMLQYKCSLAGITCILADEENTSQCSFFDNEPIVKADRHLGRRIKRGLYRTSKRQLVNADVNAALNILKHAIPDVRFSHHGIEGYANPIRLTA